MVDIIMDHRMAHAIKFHIRIIFLLEPLICPFHAIRSEAVHVLLRNFLLISEFAVHRHIHRAEHASCRSNAGFRQSSPCRCFQFFLNLPDRFSHFSDIMDLPVQHGAGFMFLHPLRHRIKTVIVSITYCSYNTSRPYIQSKNKLSRIIFSLCHRYPSNFLSICSYVSARLPPLLITTLQCFLNSSSESCRPRIPEIFSSL